MDKPQIIERFADNGEHSHWELIESKSGGVLWSEEPITKHAMFLYPVDDELEDDYRHDSWACGFCGAESGEDCDLKCPNNESPYAEYLLNSLLLDFWKHKPAPRFNASGVGTIQQYQFYFYSF